MEDLQYPLSDSDFSQQWTLLTWPSKIEKLCEKAEKNLYADNDRYQKEMEGEQAIFVNTLESLDATVNTFPNYTDMSQVHVAGHPSFAFFLHCFRPISVFLVSLKHLQAEIQTPHRQLSTLQVELVAYEARECSDRLRKAENTTRLFNSREALFGVTPTDYSRLKKISEQFEPFNALWSAADDWKKYYKSWMEESWEKLDPEAVERLVMGWWKGLLKYGREFSKRDLMVQATFCEDIRTQV